MPALLDENHYSQHTRIAKRMHELAESSHSVPLTASATSLAGGGAVVKACKLTCEYGTEIDIVIAAKLISKLTRSSTMHTHVPPPKSYKTHKVTISVKAIANGTTVPTCRKSLPPPLSGWVDVGTSTRHYKPPFDDSPSNTIYGTVRQWKTP